MENSECLTVLQAAVNSSLDSLQKYFKNVVVTLEEAHEKATEKLRSEITPIVNAACRTAEKILNQFIISLASSKERHFIKSAKKQRTRQKYRNRVWRRFLKSMRGFVDN